MMRKFSESLLIIVVTAALVIGACALMFSHLIERQRAELAPLRSENETLRAQAEENRRDIEATAQLVRDAVGRSDGQVFRTDQEIQRLNGARLDALADAIATRVAPKLPAAQSPQDIARQENQAVDRISSATAEKLEPQIAAIGNAQESSSSRQLAATQARLQTTSADLAQTQAAADEAIQLSHELSSKYLDTYKDHGVVVRVLSLPVELIRDAAGGNVINDRERRRQQEELDAKLREIEAKLNDIKREGGAPQPVAKS